MKRRFSKHLAWASLALLISAGFYLKGALPTVLTGSWAPVADLNEARAGAAAAVLLHGGGVLITGGESAVGPLASAEIFSNTGAVSAAASMQTPRSGHTATVLEDGRVLVAGGVTFGGAATALAEIYEPATGAWTSAGQMSATRSGHSATLIADGLVLIAGGTPNGTLEIFDPASGFSVVAGALSAPRRNHGAARLPGGAVLIAGGSNGAAALATTDIFNPATGQITAGPAMNLPRTGASVTALLDGRVLVAGGSNGAAGHATAEIFNPATGSFGAPITMTAARGGHSAYLLPWNAQVLLTGGSAATNSAELFAPWSNQFTATGNLGSARHGGAAAALDLLVDGRLLLAGGKNASGAAIKGTELYGYATVKTDKDDYAPGQVVTITGSGWKPGETVTLLFDEVPVKHSPRALTAVADNTGVILNTQFIPEAHDLGVRFYLTATGVESKALTTFTDGRLFQATITPTSANVGESKSYTLTVTNTSSDGEEFACVEVAIPSGAGTPNTLGVTATDPGPPPVQRSWTIPAIVSGKIRTSRSGGSANDINPNGTIVLTFTTTATTAGDKEWTVNAYSNTSCSNNPATIQTSQPKVTISSAVAATTTSLASSANPSFYGTSVNFTATVTRASGSGTGAPTGSVQFKIDGDDFGTPVSLGALTSTSATAVSSSISTLTAGTHAVTADYVPGTGFSSSTGTLSGGQSVNRKALTVSITAASKEYDATTGAAILTRTPNGVISPDVVTVTGGTANFDTKNVGTGKTVTGTGFTLDGADAGNYLINPDSATTTANITAKSVTGSFAANNKPYDGSTTATIATRSLTAGVLGGDTVNLAGGTATFDTKNVGTGKTVSGVGFTLSGGDAGNYLLASASLTTTANITPATLTVSITAASKEYDATTGAAILTRTPNGVISPDVVTVTGGTANFDTKNVGTGKTVTGTGFALDGADAGNYQINPNSATTTANITAKSVTGSFTANNKPYDGSTTATIATRSLTAGVLGGDTVNLAGGTATFDTKNVGTGKTVSGVGFTLSGGDAGNYLLASASLTTTANITPATLTVTANNKSRPYAVANPSFDATIIGFVGGENLATSGVTGNPACTSAAGSTSPVSPPTIPITCTIGTLTAGNYNFAFSPGQLTIVIRTTATTVTVSASSITEGMSTGLTLVVTDTDQSPAVTPTGVVSLTANSALTFSALTCVGSPGILTCTGSVTGKDDFSGKIMATFSGDSFHSGSTGSTLTNFVVTNVLPVITTANANVSPFPTDSGLSVSFTDVGVEDTHSSCTFISDSSDPSPIALIAGTVTESNGSGTCSATYPSRPVGVYPVNVTVTDDDGGAATVLFYVVFYDPNAGFVTGGGWINSPPGAYVPDSTLTGKATFGFVAKYKKGANVPEGNTEFQFHTAKMNFKSTSYSYLVVQGTARAQYKGYGTINGAGNYMFIVSIVDGDAVNKTTPDKFRIKISDVATGTLIYDNNMGALESDEPTTVLGGGSIQIQTK